MAESEYRRKNFFTDNKAFIFYKDWYELFFCLDDEHEIVELLRAVLVYASSGKLPDFKGGLKGCFVSIAQSIKRDGEKWKDTCEKRSKAGKNGGRPPKNIEIEASVNELKGQLSLLADETKKAIGFLSMQNQAKKADTETETETETESERDKRSLSPPPLDDAKMTCGEYMHVFLTREQYSKLANDFGLDKTAEYIRRADEYCQQTGKQYNDYYATIRRWIREDAKKAADKKEEKISKAKSEGQNSSLPPAEELERIIMGEAAKKDPADVGTISGDAKASKKN